MPITMANAGDRVIIKEITGNDEIRQHLAEWASSWIQM